MPRQFELTYSELSGADKILLNGKILSVDARFSTHQPIVLNGDRILQVGSNQDIKSLATSSTQIFDLEDER